MHKFAKDRSWRNLYFACESARMVIQSFFFIFCSVFFFYFGLKTFWKCLMSFAPMRRIACVHATKDRTIVMNCCLSVFECIPFVVSASNITSVWMKQKLLLTSLWYSLAVEDFVLHKFVLEEWRDYARVHHSVVQPHRTSY